jgi:uncharacterized protein (TIGR03437 family)
MVLKRTRRIGTLAALFLALWPLGASETELDRYVAEPDPAYSWRLVATIPVPALGFRTYVLEMTSQRWRSEAEVDRPVWRHWLRIVVPASVRFSTAFLLVNGGSTDEPQPAGADLALGLAAVASQTVVADLQAVPNQPLLFRDETRPRSEDALVAYTWDKFLRGGDERWPLQLPMTKAAVRAMDTVSAFLKTPEGGGLAVDKFIVSGASKRGWVAWLAAAVDRRVVAAVPLVIDVLHVEPSFRHHWQAYGFWAPAVSDYEELGVMAWLGSRRQQALLRLIDPFSYRDRLALSKYIVNAAGDQFFLPDSSRFYFDELPGEKYLRYVPNSSHSLEEGDVLASILAYAQMILADAPRPRLSWEFAPGGAIVVRAQDRPSEVKLWEATNPAARDFRVATIGRAWTSSPLEAGPGGSFEARPSPPAQGWTAFFVELSYSAGALTLKLTTPVRVIPETMPFPAPLAAFSAATDVPLTAPEGIVSLYGSGLAAGALAAVPPLPAELGGVEVQIRDSRNLVGQGALYFVSPTQVNFVLPREAAPGLARVALRRHGQEVASGAVLVEDVAPAFFSANGDGAGVAAALSVTVKPDGRQIIREIFDVNAPAGRRRPVPTSLGEPGDQVYLSLFGTGLRHAPGEGSARVGGLAVPVAGPVAQPQYPGLDQVNLGPLPRALAGRGEVPIEFTLRGKAANLVTVTFQ